MLLARSPSHKTFDLLRKTKEKQEFLSPKHGVLRLRRMLVLCGYIFTWTLWIFWPNWKIRIYIDVVPVPIWVKASGRLCLLEWPLPVCEWRQTPSLPCDLLHGSMSWLLTKLNFLWTSLKLSAGLHTPNERAKLQEIAENVHDRDNLELSF